MKGKCMRLISFFLSFVLLFSLLPVMSLAAEERIVLLKTDFEEDTVGTTPKGFDNAVATAEACMFVTEDGANKVLKGYHGTPYAEGAAVKGPRLDLNISTGGLTNMRVEYDVKSSCGASLFKIYFTGSSSGKNAGTINTPYDYKEWTHITVDMDVVAQRATVYADGKKETTATLKFGTEGTVVMRLACTLEPDDSWVMIDNVQISTTDKDYKLNQGISVAGLQTEYKEENAKAETGNIVTILDVDFEDHEVGSLPKYNSDGGFNTGAVTDIACMRVEEADGNKYIRAYHGNPKDYPEVRGGRLERTVTKSGLKKMTIDYDVKSSLGATLLNIDFYPTSATKYLCRLRPPYEFKEWTHVKIRCDFETGKAVIYVGGKEYATKTINYGDETAFKIRISTSVDPDGSYLFLDNFKVTSPDLDLGGAVSLSGDKVDWTKLKIDPSLKTGMLDVMRMEHPRLFVTDWDALRAKSESSDTYRVFKKNLLRTAEGYVNSEPTKYVKGSTGTINGATTTVKANAIVLSAAYKLTGDVRYKNRLYAELEAAGNWPDWGSSEFLCTAHMNLGYAIAYDWLYHDWTEEERNNIKTWLMEMGLSQAVLAYEGFIAASWTRSDSNWNNVCNGSNMIAALALADSEPEMADYILYKTSMAIPYMFCEISEEGAYVEPLGYWDYGIRHLVKTMSALDTCLLPGASLPASLDFKDVTGLNNTGDFPIYYNGAAQGFNYGDGEAALRVTPILYYFATKYDKPQYAWYERNMRETNPNVTEVSGKDAVWSLIWYDEAHAQGADMEFPLDKFYASKEKGGAKAMSMRSGWGYDDALIVMAMAGDAEAGHAHHNAGAFILDWAGTRWAHIYGRNVPGYSSTPYDWDNYFLRVWEGGRYDYYHTRGEGNNTIIANPQQNRADLNLDYVTHLEKYESGEDKAYGVINMTDTNTDYVSALRGFMLTDNRRVMILQDEIQAKKPSEYYWFMNTHADVTLAPDGKSALLEQKGKKMLVRITQGPAAAKIGVMPAIPLPTSPNPSVQPVIEEHKLFIHVENEQNLNLTVEFAPIDEGVGIPAPQPVVPLANWSVSNAPKQELLQTFGDAVALMVDNPNAYAQGQKTYVDTKNLEIRPIVQNGRTLVPVRFIAEKFGANVGWEDATQTVSVQMGASTITLQIGSAQMYVNGIVTTLDVPAQTIGGRTLIPLRALVEALGKQVFWDDRGLILISNETAVYDAVAVEAFIELLRIKHTDEIFAGVLGTGSPGVAKYVNLLVDSHSAATYQTYLDIVSAASSIEWDEKYPMQGSYDGIINGTITQNRWSADGAGHWITYDLGAVKNLHSVAIAGFKASQRAYTFKISTSTDGENWTVVHPEVQTLLGPDRTVINLGDVQARYLRLDGLKSSNSSWMGISEIRIYDSAQMQKDDQENWNAYFYTESIVGKAGQALRLIVEGETALGEKVPLDISKAILTSADPSIVSVDAGGNVKLIKSGATIVRGQIEINGILKATSIRVEVE